MLPPERSSMTLGSWCEAWLARIRELQDREILRATTIDAYERISRLHFGPLLALPVGELKRPVLLAWANEQIKAGCSRKTLVVRVAVLKVCLRDAMGEGLIEMNPAERLISSLRLPRAVKKVRWFEDREAAARFIQAAEDGPEWTGLALMLFTGIRIGEALGLRWEDVDLDGRRAVICRQTTQAGAITTPKSEAGARGVDLPTMLVDVLRRKRAWQLEEGMREGRPGTPWVLGVTPEHNSAGRKRLRAALERALKVAGLPRLTPHGLRHSWISFRGLMLQDPRLIQAQAGHSDARMTAQYTHLYPSDPAAADEVAESIRPRQSRLFGGPKKS